ncbi:unnamed protein product [Lepidochelys kempii]
MAMDTWRLEGTQHPPCNCQKSPTCGVVVALIVVSSALIAAIIALAVLTSQLSSADLCPLLAPCARTAGWDTKGNATISQRGKGAGPTARAAALQRVPPWLGSTVSRKRAFLLRHKGVRDHWIGLRREQGQPWKWTNGTKFNHLGAQSTLTTAHSPSTGRQRSGGETPAPGHCNLSAHSPMIPAAHADHTVWIEEI